MSPYKRAQQSPLQGSKSNQRSQHSRCVARFAAWMVFSLRATGTFTAFIFFFFLFTEIFFPPSVDPLQGFQIFSSEKKKKKAQTQLFFFFLLHVNVEFRQSCSQRFRLHHFSSASRFQVVHSGWRRLPEGLPLQLAPLAQFPRFHCRFYSATSFISSHSLFLTLALCCFTHFFCSHSLRFCCFGSSVRSHPRIRDKLFVLRNFLFLN